MITTMVSKKYLLLVLTLIIFSIIAYFNINFKEEKKDFYLTLGSNTFAKKEKEKTFYHIYIGEYNGFGKIYDFEKKFLNKA